MVERASSIADLLADETGNLRPEAVDFLMDIRPQGDQQQRIRPPRGQVPRGRRRRRRVLQWLFTSLILVVLIIAIKAFISNHVESNRSIEMLTVPYVASEADDQSELALPIQPRSESLAQEEDNTVSVTQAVFLAGHDPKEKNLPNDNGSDQLNYTQLEDSMILGKAKTYGYHVNIRQAPRLDSDIIRQTTQGEVFLLSSFSGGWYEILLEDTEPGYIFGAYLLPLDFQLPGHMLGVARDCTKLLLAASECPGCWQVILPDGTKRYIHKNDVKIIN